MQDEIGFAALQEALSVGSQTPAAKSRLNIADMPDPFVAPTLTAASGSAQLFSAEIIFIEAPAAVGKSTMARCLSASRRAPLLDLSKVPVATGSLKSLISDLPGAKSIEEFHAGKLPIIIDALDEGLMLSGEKGFEAFLETTGELLLSDRREMGRPKIIVLGRRESIDLARVGLELSGGEIKMSSAKVGFFDEAAAYKMIEAYALKVAKPAAAYRKNPGPARALIAAYFDAIESALGLAKTTLWLDPMGRAFAGYAPVLSAIGLLLADMDNFQQVENKLREEGTTKAWNVLEDVLQTVLERERGKLCDQLATKISVAVPPEAYDVQEQLTYITQYVHGQTLSGSSRVRLQPNDLQMYESLVGGYLKEHPFIREGKLENAVLGSVVLAHAIVNDLLRAGDLDQVAALSKQPFLWRSVRKQMARDALLDGKYLGYLLASFWNEPMPQGDRIIIRSSDGESARVFVDERGRGETALVNVTLPIMFFGEARDCDVDVQGTVELQGRARGSQQVFEVHGHTTIICEELRVKAESLMLHGAVWLEAQAVDSSPKLELALRTDTKVGWAGQLAQHYPWKRFEPTLAPPYGQVDDKLTKLLEECVRRLPGALTFNADYSVVDDMRMRWASREFGVELPTLARLLVAHNLASTAKIPINLLQVHLKVTWPDLLAAQNADTPPAHLNALIVEARDKIKND